MRHRLVWTFHAAFVLGTCGWPPAAHAQSAGVSTPAATIRWGAEALRQKPGWYAAAPT